MELTNTAAFIDNLANQQLFRLDINDNAGSYSLDMALRLKRPEVQEFKEVFIFSDSTLTNSAFRALAENVFWRDFDNSILGDLNY